MKVVAQVLMLALALAVKPAVAAVPPEQANFDATKIKPFATQMLKYESTEKTGDFPGPWTPGAWANGAVGRIETVADGGDGKAAVRMMNVSGQPSLMFKPWTEVSLSRGAWEARVEYRKVGKASGRLDISGPDKKSQGVELSPTGAAFKPAVLPLEVAGSTNVKLAFQLYGGTGEDEALYIRSFNLVRVGDVSATTKAAEQQANAALNAEAEAVAKREAARRAAERKPIRGWVRPEAKPVPMTKPLDPPPVTGKTYFVAAGGNNETGDGSQGKPWRSIQHGMNQLHPGDRLYIRGGEYRESMLNFPRSGKPDAYITVAGYPGETAKVIHSGNGLAVFNISSGSPWTPIRLEEQAYLVIRDLHIDAVKTNQAVRIAGPMHLPEYKGNLTKSRGLVHNIWVVGCDITGGNGNESVIGSGYGSHDIIISNNRIRDMVGGVNAFLYSDGTIIEWNTVFNTSSEQDDAGAIKSMAPGVIIRYNTVHGNNRSPVAKKPGWAPTSEGGKQWRFLQGVTGIYIDYGMVDDKNNIYPKPLIPADPANYVYGNTVYNNNAGIFAFLSDNAQIYDNVIHSNGRNNTGGWVEGKEGGKWLEFVGPAGYGITTTYSKNAKVFNNLSYNNQKGGLGTEDIPSLEAYNNVFFGNDLAQVHFRKGDAGAVGFNTIIATEKQGVPFLRGKSEEFATADALRAKYPYLDEGTRVVPVKPGTDALALARQLLKTNAVSPARWGQAREALQTRAIAAGIGVAPKTVPQAAFDPTRSLQAPLPKALPATIEFENYDVGGPDVSFKDNSVGNEGEHYRKDAVDIKADPKAGNGAVVGFTQNGEWMEYTVNVAKAGVYPLSVTYATPETGRRIRLSLNGKPLGEAITFTPTASWNELKTMEAGTVSLPSGDAVLRVTIENGPVDLDRLEFKPAR